MAREFLSTLVIMAVLAARASAEPALPETQLPLRLMGTVVAAQAERSIAVIENAGATAVVRPGDAIGGARVQEIHKDGVVLEQNGRRERLAFASVAVARSAGSTQTDAATPAAPRDDHAVQGGSDPGWRKSAKARSSRAQARARAARATAVPASAASDDSESSGQASQVASSDQLLVNLSSQARYAPLLDEEGQLHGVALIDVKPDSTLERIGLRSGDVVVSVAGVKVDNSSRALDALRALDPRAGGVVMVERGGVPTRINVPPGAL